MQSSILSNSAVLQGIRDDIDGWAATLRIAFDRFASSSGYTNVALNVRVVSIALQSWIDDLDRYSVYHKNEQGKDCDPDSYKLMAYLMYWLSRTKPIYLTTGKYLGGKHPDSEFLTKRYDTINEIFAFQVCTAFLGLDLVEIPDETAYNFIYLLYYRNVNPKHLFITLELLRKTISSKSA